MSRALVGLAMASTSSGETDVHFGRPCRLASPAAVSRRKGFG